MEDVFIVNAIDQKFEKVSRIEARSERLEVFMQLDVNTEIYPIKIEEKFAVKLTPTLNADGTADTGYYTQSKQGSIADKYEYIMHGKLYKITDEGSGANAKAEVLISFGGLLLSLKGNPDYITDFQLDQSKLEHHAYQHHPSGRGIRCGTRFCYQCGSKNGKCACYYMEDVIGFAFLLLTLLVFIALIYLAYSHISAR